MSQSITSNDNKQIIKKKLNKRDWDKIELLGMFVFLILEKDCLKKNSDVSMFILEILGEQLPGYIVKSRTLMAARISRTLLRYDNTDTKEIKEKVDLYLKKIAPEEEKPVSSTSQKKKKKNENDKLEKWLKGF